MPPALKHCFLLLLLCACRKERQSSCADQSTSLYKISNFNVGAAVHPSLLNNNIAYRDIVIQQFNVVKPDDSYLLYKIHPQPDQFDFSEYDYLVDFCKKYQKHLQGSNLIYQLYLPDWIINFQGSQADWEALAKNHIQTVVKRYKGIVESWVAVNEALNEDGTLQQNIWLKNIGSTYIEKFFKWAHEADPDALLFYNDFNLESNSTKLKAALDLVDVLRSNGAQVDGLGLQMHINDIYPTIEEINKAAILTASHDLKVYYSEWDISLNAANNKTSLTQDMMERQKYIVKNIVEGYKELPEKYRYGISFWNVGDGDSWIRTQFHRIDWPLLFDDNYQRKPAFCGYVETFEN
jgi:endo-1,4-beta-xylanase